MEYTEFEAAWLRLAALAGWNAEERELSMLCLVHALATTPEADTTFEGILASAEVMIEAELSGDSRKLDS
jgi:hypothetical protein